MFKKLPPNEIDKIKRAFINNGVNIRGEKTTVLNESLIDSAKVLRILLEYFRREKKTWLFILEKLFKEQREIQLKGNRQFNVHKSDPYRGGLSFDSFK